MKKIIVGCLLSLITYGAYAWQFEGGVGESYFPDSGNGVYYEDGPNFPHSLSLHEPAFEFGVTGDIGSSFGWHADLVDLGSVKTDATVDSSDANYSPSTGGCNGPCAPTETMHGSGSIIGIALTGEVHHEYYGFRLAAEAGPFIFVPQWSVTISNPYGSTTYRYASTVQVGAVLGASVGRGPYSLAFQYFFDRTKGSPSPGIWTGTYLLVARYKF
jgi:hypothetical protein